MELTYQDLYLFSQGSGGFLFKKFGILLRPITLPTTVEYSEGLMPIGISKIVRSNKYSTLHEYFAAACDGKQIMGYIINAYHIVVSVIMTMEGAEFIRQNKSGISTAIAMLGTWFLYKKVIKPPRHLRHLPYLGTCTYIRAILQQKRIDQVTRDITLPAFTETDSGMYVRFDHAGWGVHVANPLAAQTVLTKTDTLFLRTDVVKEYSGTIIGNFIYGPSLGTLGGSHWRAQRKVANRAFHRSMPIDTFGRLTQKLFRVMAGLEETVDFHALSERWALDAIGIAGFDFDFGAIENPHTEWVTRYESIIDACFDPLYFTFPALDKYFLFLLPHRRRLHKELAILLGKINEVIERKRQMIENDKSTINKPENEKDLLTLMIEAERNGKGTMTNHELQSNICTFFAAGHDTTANAVACAAYYLAVNQEIQEEARQEAIRIMGDTPEDLIPTADQLYEITFINMIIKETLRCNPPASTLVSRKARQDTELNGVFIPGGTTVSFNVYELHHNPQVWKDPETFDPDRFSPNGEAEQMSDSGWAPFGNGGHLCIGMNFSLTEQRVFLLMLLRKFTWTLPEDSIHKHLLITKGTSMIKPINLELTFQARY